VDRNEIWADRIRAGAPVGDTMLWGMMAVRLVRFHGVSQDRIREYRESHHKQLIKAYGPEDAEKIIDRNQRFHIEAENTANERWGPA